MPNSFLFQFRTKFVALTIESCESTYFANRCNPRKLCDSASLKYYSWVNCCIIISH